MCADQATGSIVTLICDGGDRYTDTYYDDAWLAEQGIDIGPYLPVVERAWDEQSLGLPVAGMTAVAQMPAVTALSSSSDSRMSWACPAGWSR